MKSVIAVVLVVMSLAAAEPPRFRASARQTAASAAQSAPYNPRGWRPQGAPFTLPQSQPQQSYGPPSEPQQAYGAPAPAASYGPPPLEPTTTEDSIGESTEPPQTGKISSNSKATSSKTSAAAQSPGSYYVVLPQSAVVYSQPQSQNLVYAVTEVQRSAPLVTVPQATIVAAPLTSAQVQPLPVSTFKAVYSPLTESYVIYS